MIETVDDIIESLADELGIYGAHIDLHPDGQCECRVCWTSQLRGRLDSAFEVEQALDRHASERIDRVGSARAQLAPYKESQE